MWWTDLAARSRGPAFCLLAAASLAACAPLSANGPDVALTPTEQYSVQVKETPDQVAFTAHAEGLSPAQRTALVSLVDRWRQAPDAGDIVIRAPAGGDPAASRTSGDLVSGLHAMGVPGERVRIGDYDGSVGGPVLASYTHLEAHGPDCEGGWNNITSTGSNRTTTHFGCAVTANFAAQVADPRDFLNPQPVTPSDAARREIVIDKYRKGELTSTVRDEQAVGAISSAVGSK